MKRDTAAAADPNAALRAASRQEQFLEVIDRDEALARFERAVQPAPLGEETVPIGEALGRVLARDVLSPVDVPGFDRANVDGFAVVAADTYGASEEEPVRLRLNREVLAPGREPAIEVAPGTASPIATGAMLPRGADAVVMIEHTEPAGRDAEPAIDVRGTVAPGRHVSFAGTDVGRGETILRAGHQLGSREIGVLAATGIDRVAVHRRPRVAILSTGDELLAPGAPPRAGAIYDSNAAILAAALVEIGCEPIPLGIVPDDAAALEAALDAALVHDAVLLSGGTSKGAGDLSYRCVHRLRDPGVVAHGVALKPGKPICLAATGRKPVVVLPGFPTSAIFTFHELVAPVLRRLAGVPEQSRRTLPARLPLRVNSERGRTEYVLVSLVETGDGLAAYPMGKGSGAVTAFSFADGFVAIDADIEMLDAGAPVTVQLIGQRLEPADLVVIGSHCVGLDVVLTALARHGLGVKSMHVGSLGGLAAARRGECDLAGIHLLDPASGVYNRPLLEPGLVLVPGYGRMQGIVHRAGDARFEGRDADAALAAALADPGCVMVNRNAGSGTRILVDGLLDGVQPRGYAVQPKSHNAVAAAVAQERADWGVAIDTVARQYGLNFIALREERYDFVVPEARLERPAVRAFRDALASAPVREALASLGFLVDDAPPPVWRPRGG